MSSPSKSYSDGGKPHPIAPQEYLLFAVLLALIVWLTAQYQETQKPASVGLTYYQMALPPFDGQSLQQRAPFMHRQLMPTLAALLANKGGNSA